MTGQLLIAFFVEGTAAPGGSKKFVGMSKKTGRAILVDDAGKRNKDWRAIVAWTARSKFKGELYAVPLRFEVDFFVQRPLGHFSRGDRTRNLVPSAPKFPAVKPDCLKLTRSTEDALTGVLWVDDALIVTELITKRYSTIHTPPGAYIRVFSEPL